MVFPDWTTKPIPNLSLSASGVVALADLSTIAQRTAITGGSKWLDSLILAPGLHYQQAADELVKEASQALVEAVEEGDDKPITFRIHNAATANYIRRVAKPGETVELDVGCLPASRGRYRLKRSDSGMHATVWQEDEMPDLGRVSHLLYLASPFLTAAAVIFDVLLQDWWGVGLLLSLMLSRTLNIWVIKQRAKPTQSRQRPTDPDPTKGPMLYSNDEKTISGPPKLTKYHVKVGDGKASVLLRGTPEDLRAITEDSWLRAKTYIEGYLEAAAKLIVYLVAALSGNMTQAGQIIQLSLLLTTAGLLALSNSHAKSFRVNGRVAAPRTPSSGGGGGDSKIGSGNDTMQPALPAQPQPQPQPPYEKWGPAPQYPRRGRGDRERRRHRDHEDSGNWEDKDPYKKTDSWPSSEGETTTETGSVENDYYYEGGRRGGTVRRVENSGAGYDSRMDDWAERGQVRHPLRHRYSFEEGGV